MSSCEVHSPMHMHGPHIDHSVTHIYTQNKFYVFIFKEHNFNYQESKWGSQGTMLNDVEWEMPIDDY